MLSLQFAFGDRGMTVVEVQRIAGCGFEYSQAAKGVCRSAKGLSSIPKRKLPMPKCIPRESPDERIRRIESGVTVALNMFVSTHTDLQLLGLESLRQITASEDSAFVTGMVLKGEYLEKIISLVTANDADLFSEIEKRNFIVLQRITLTVLSQCLQNSAPDEVSRIVGGINLKALVDALVQFLDMSATRPHEAVFAIRCLQSFSEVQEVRDDLVLANSISTLCSSAEHQTLLLETECQKLKSLLL